MRKPAVPFPWSEAARERATHLYLVDGYSAGKVAEALTSEFKHSVSRSAVIGILNRMKVKREAAAKPKVEFERIMPKRKPRPRAASATPMIAELKTSRKTPKGGDRKGATRPAYSTLTGMRIGVSTQKGYVPAEPPAAPPRNLTLMQLGKCDCRWPVTASAPFFFCGHKAVPGSPYCSDHTSARSQRDQAAALRQMETYAEAFGGGA